MANAETIESYLKETGLTWEKLADNTWMINDEYDTIDNIVVYLNDPVVFFRVKLMDIPKDCDRQALFETLLLKIQSMKNEKETMAEENLRLTTCLKSKCTVEDDLKVTEAKLQSVNEVREGKGRS